MSAQRITQYGMRLFVKNLADTLVAFQRTPLDDRDPTWVMRHLRERLQVETVRFDLAESHKVSIVALFYRLDWLCMVLDLQVEYNDDQY